MFFRRHVNTHHVQYHEAMLILKRASFRVHSMLQQYLVPIKSDLRFHKLLNCEQILNALHHEKPSGHQKADEYGEAFEKVHYQ